MSEMALFLFETFSSPFMFLAVMSALLLMLVNGWTDAPVSIASAVTTGALSLRQASCLSAVFNFIGAVSVSFLGNSVAVSVAELSGLGSASGALASVGFTAALLSVVVWSLIALYLGLATSESHALISSLAGASACVLGFGAINRAAIIKVVAGLFISTAPVVFLSKKVAIYMKKRFSVDRNRQKFQRLQVVGAMMSAFAHGAQDGQKFAGIFAVQTALIMGKKGQVTVPLYAVALSAVLISVGMLLGGGKIVNSMSEFSPKDALSGFSADATSSMFLCLMSVLGIPASTTSTKTSAVLGAGGKQLRKGGPMFAAWGLTFPACFILGYVLTLWLKRFAV